MITYSEENRVRQVCDLICSEPCCRFRQPGSETRGYRVHPVLLVVCRSLPGKTWAMCETSQVCITKLTVKI